MGFADHGKKFQVWHVDANMLELAEFQKECIFLYEWGDFKGCINLR